MIIFFSRGRIGNQLFQYAFLNTIVKKKERIYGINMDDFVKYFNIENKNFKNISLKRGYIIRIIKSIMMFFVKIKIIGYIFQKRDLKGRPLPEYIKKRGLLPIRLIKSDYFQSPSLFNSEKIDFSLKEEYIIKAKEFLANIPPSYKRCFIHIRRGDYLFIEYDGYKGINLPKNYYIKAIEIIKKEAKDIFFIFLSDDPEFVEYCYNEIENKIISREKEAVDLAIMMECEYGIISNSSFSWWGAYLMKNRKKVIFPKYWYGWKSKIEFHSEIYPEWGEIIEPN